LEWFAGWIERRFTEKVTSLHWFSLRFLLKEIVVVRP